MSADVTSSPINDAEPRAVSQVVEHLFRHESAKIVATLTRIFGIEHLPLAEDVVQETLARALRTWPFYGVPQNPAAWMMRASRNLALDAVRRQKVFRDKESQIVQLIELASVAPDEVSLDEVQIEDDRLRMMFVCSHPLVPEDAQAALALKILCGFSVTEISRAFLTTEDAIAKRLTRARQRIRQEHIPFEIPSGAELENRVDGVLKSLYLLFNEGYKASSGDNLVREDVCHEAIRLANLLARHPAGQQPKTHALLALMLLNTARNPARSDAAGNLLLLRDQDRSKWDRKRIAQGMFHFAQSADGHELTSYHLQAGIAASHCIAKDYDSTDWPNILALYDRLIEVDSSPVAALNRAIAVANIHGAKAGMDAIMAMENRDKLSSYYLFYAVLGEFESRLNNFDTAIGHFRQSLQLAGIESEKAFLSKKILACTNQASH